MKVVLRSYAAMTAHARLMRLVATWDLAEDLLLILSYARIGFCFLRDSDNQCAPRAVKAKGREY